MAAMLVASPANALNPRTARAPKGRMFLTNLRVAGSGFDAEGQEPAGTKRGSGGLEGGPQLAQVDEHIRGGEKIESARALAQQRDQIAHLKAVINAALFGLLNHAGGEINARQRRGNGAQERPA